MLEHLPCLNRSTTSPEELVHQRAHRCPLGRGFPCQEQTTLQDQTDV